MILLTKKLRHQIVILCLSLVFITSLSVLISFWWFSSRYTENHIQSAFNGAINVFEQYANTKAGLLTTAAQVLTADFGFKQAVASRDSATLASALKNHSDRIKADLMLVADRDGTIITSSDAQLEHSESLNLLVRALIAKKGQTLYADFNQRLYQVVALPVKAPHTIAFAITGFEINSDVTEELKELTDLDVSFYNGDQLLTTSLIEISDKIHSQLTAQQRNWLLLQRPKFANSSRNIASLEQQEIRVLLSDDLTPIYDSFDQLVLTTVIIAGIIILFALLASVLLANSLTTPLATLVKGVNRFAQGHYESNLNINRASTEIQALIKAFNNMGLEIKQREKHIIYQAQHDLLTGLRNREAFFAKVDESLQVQSSFTLLAIHIRALQRINDNLGFDIGDACLKTIATRVQNDLNKVDVIHGRLGDDLILSLIPTSSSGPEMTMLKHILDNAQLPISVQSLELNIHINAGVCLFPDDGDTAKSLVRRSIIAVDEARKQNLPLRFYQKGEDEAHLERLAIMEDLKTALSLDDGQLYMHYQPKQRLKTGEIEKLEALIRWQRPASGFVPPDVFIDLAEKAGLIIELTHWVLNTVFRQVAQWQRQDIEIQVAVNISAQDLNHPDFFNTLQATLSRHGIEPRLITLELTERDLMTNEALGVALMQQLRDAGYCLSVDDYGIGQSSLGKLKQLPVHELKIDKSFILKLDESKTDQMIVRSSIELGHNLGLSVVAEGVENETSLQLLREMGCDFIQGYYLAKPMSADDIKQWLMERKIKPLRAGPR